MMRRRVVVDMTSGRAHAVPRLAHGPIEHHLFPHICHVHYPRIAAIVEATCAEFNVRYTVHAGLFSAIASHWRWLRRMGRPAFDGTCGGQFGGGAGSAGADLMA